MPNIKSAKKRVLVAEARNARNKANKSALKTAIKKFEAAAVEGNRTEAEGTYKVAVKAIDKAAAKGLLHKNNAAHKKSALTLKRTTLANNQTQRVSERMPVLLCPQEDAAPSLPAGSGTPHRKKLPRPMAAGVFSCSFTSFS